jgi:hypothetical protein
VQLDEALDQISQIRQQMARAQVFRGYRSATTLFTAVVAVVAALAQAAWVPQPMRGVEAPAGGSGYRDVDTYWGGNAYGSLNAYLATWCAAAVVSIVVVGAEMVVRSRRSGSSLQRQITLVVVDQFAPSLAAGALLTFVVARFARDAAWMLPGLWAILFSLGLFASRRFLPRGVFLIGGYYLVAGLVCLTLDRKAAALSPWTMGVVFGAGQLLTAGFLYWTLERGHGRREQEQGD